MITSRRITSSISQNRATKPTSRPRATEVVAGVVEAAEAATTTSVSPPVVHSHIMMNLLGLSVFTASYGRTGGEEYNAPQHSQQGGGGYAGGGGRGGGNDERESTSDPPHISMSLMDFNLASLLHTASYGRTGGEEYNSPHHSQQGSGGYAGHNSTHLASISIRSGT